MSYAILPLRSEDLAGDPALVRQLLEIEARSFPIPWTAEALGDELLEPLAFIDIVYEVRGAAPGGEGGPGGARRAVALCSYRQLYDEVHVMQIATHPDERQRGHAGRLLDHMLAAATARRCRAAVLELRQSNLAARRLYRKHGFTEVGLRKAYYSDDNEDAIVMIRHLGPFGGSDGNV